MSQYLGSFHIPFSSIACNTRQILLQIYTVIFSMSWKYIFKVGDREIGFVAGSESYLNDQLELVTRETCQKEKNKIIVSVSGADILNEIRAIFWNIFSFLEIITIW